MEYFQNSVQVCEYLPNFYWVLTAANSVCTRTEFIMSAVHITHTAAYPTSAGAGCRQAPEDVALSFHTYFCILLIMLCCGQQNGKQAGAQLWWLVRSSDGIWVKSFAASGGKRKKDGLTAQAVELCFKNLNLSLLQQQVFCAMSN